MLSLFHRKKAKSHIEKRGSPRVALVDYYLFYLKDPLRDTSAIRGEVINLSKEGVLFESLDPFDPGSELALKLQIPYKNEFIRASGRIIRIERGSHPFKARVAASYTKILNGPKELLFDTLVHLVTEKKEGDD